MSLLLCCVRSAHKVTKLPVFSLELTLLTFSDSFHIIVSQYVVRFYVFYSEKGGGGDELSFRFIVLLHHGLSCVLQ